MLFNGILGSFSPLLDILHVLYNGIPKLTKDRLLIRYSLKFLVDFFDVISVKFQNALEVIIFPLDVEHTGFELIVHLVVEAMFGVELAD